MLRLLALFCLLGSTLVTFGQVSLSFYVTDGLNNEALSGVIVSADKLGAEVFSTTNGWAKLRLPAGDYHFHVTKQAYQAKHITVRLLADTVIAVTLNPTYIELNEVLVEERLTHASNREISVAVDALDAQAIAQAGANNLADALSHIAGLNVLSTGVGIAKPVIRGFTGNRVLVVDNGLRQEGQQWGLDHGLEIDEFRVQRVEVIKGPAAIQYGSDATAGAIHILPEAVPQDGLHGAVAGVFRSNNTTRAGSASLSFKKQSWYALTRFSLQRYQDYEVPATSFTYNGFVLPIVDNRLMNTGGKAHNVQLLVGKRTSTGNAYVQFTQFNQMAGLFPGAIGIPRANVLTNPGAAATLGLPLQFVRHTRVLAHFNKQLQKGWLEVDMGWQQNMRQELSPAHTHGYLELDPSDSLALQMKLRTASVQATYHAHLAQEIELTSGITTQYQTNAIAGFEYLIPNYTNWQGGAYAHVRKPLGSIVLINAGIRLDGAQVRAQKHAQPWYKNIDSLVVRTPRIERNFLNWAAAVGINVNPSASIALKGNYARTFRMPSIAELGANGVHHGTFRHEVGNAALRPERAHQFDAGITVSKSRWLVQTNGFFNYFSNIIYLTASGQFSPLPDAGQLYTYTQDRALHTGFEVYAEYHPLKMVHLESTTEYVHTYNLTTQTGLPFTPPFIQQFSVLLSGGKKYPWHTGLTWLGASAQHNTDRNEPPTPGYSLIHANAGMEVEVGSTTITINVIGRNLLNTAYLNNMSRYRILNVPEQGRNIILQARLHF